MIADNRFMLRALQAADDVFHFPACLDLTLTGPDYKVRDIKYFIKSESAPLDDYLCIRIFDDSYAIIYAGTRDAELLAECFSYVFYELRGIAEFELRTPHEEIFRFECFARFFTVIEPTDSMDPVYFLHTQSELADIPTDPSVSVSLASDADKAALSEASRRGQRMPDGIGPDIFERSPLFRDTRLYLLRTGGSIAGYLRAECAYANIYNIGWLYILPEFRGRGYAVQLTMRFSRDCFANGWIPHYGFAVSKESERVAEKCGFRRDTTPIFCNLIGLRPAISAG